MPYITKEGKMLRCEACDKEIDQTVTDWDLGLADACLCYDCYDKERELYDMKMEGIDNLYFK